MRQEQIWEGEAASNPGASRRCLLVTVLSNELILRILAVLPATTILCVCPASHQLCDLSRDEHLWRELCLRDHAATTRPMYAAGVISSFRAHYFARQAQNTASAAAPIFKLSDLWWMADVFDGAEDDAPRLHSDVIAPLTEWPQDATFRSVVAENAPRFEFGIRRELLEDAGRYHPRLARFDRVRVRWSVLRATDSKVAVIADEFPEALVSLMASELEQQFPEVSAFGSIPGGERRGGPVEFTYEPDVGLLCQSDSTDMGSTVCLRGCTLTLSDSSVIDPVDDSMPITEFGTVCRILTQLKWS